MNETATLEGEERILRELEAQRDETLGKLRAQKVTIDTKIREQKKKIAIMKGEIVRLVKDLKCERHPEVKFVRIKKIDNSFWFAVRKKRRKKKVRDLWVYTCKECLQERKAGKILPHQISKAYQCPHCGLVKGDFVSRHYRSPEESWAALAGREGEHYYCRICGSQIGYYYWKFS